ncbi:RAQPRD family integrative conjugative element protein [Dickeya fangzhongdai]|uniref:integrative conjugative element protein, RAQPRD family n=1 Tax=Dickeya fangzhongdai TaxID=1778540 RepID=UPI0009E0A98E
MCPCRHLFLFVFGICTEDELALVMRQLDQEQAALNRAQVIASQNSGGSARYYFDYSSATRDITAMKLGIERYLQPSRAQPVTGQYSCKYPTKTAHSLLEIFRHTDYVP